MNKLLFYISSLHWGGAETHMYRLLNSLIELNNIYLFIASKGGVYEKKIDKRIKIIYGLKNKKLETTYSLINGTLKLRIIINKIKPDIVFSMMDHVNISAIIALSLSKYKPILICGIHNTPSQKYTKKSTLKMKFRFYLMSFLYNYPDSIVACSNGVKEDLLSVFPNLKTKIKVLYNAAITDEISSYYNSEKESNDIPILVACGRLIKQKGYDVLLKSFYYLLKKKEAYLYIIGDGIEREYLENLSVSLNISNNVTFLGYLENPYTKMSESDILVLTSIYEGYPQVLLEAMSIGVPIVSVDCPHGPKEMISTDINGILIKNRNPKEISKGIIKLLTNTTLKNQIIKNARAFSKTKEANTIAIKHHEFINKLIKIKKHEK